MDRTTWVDPTVVAWLGEHAVSLQVDVDQEKETTAFLRVKAMPSVIAFRAGIEVDRVVGMRGPADLLLWLEGLLRGETSADQVRRAAAATPDDMQARYGLARTLLTSRRFEEATEEYVWLWHHILEKDPAFVGVRGSYMLADIRTLIAEHAPARVRFTEVRDAIGPDGAAMTVTPDEVRDWIQLTRTLGQDDVVLRWFAKHREALVARSEKEWALAGELVSVLTEHGQWADAAPLFRDPIESLRRRQRALDATRVGALPASMESHRAMMIAAEEQLLRDAAAVTVASFLAAGRSADASEVADEVRRLLPGEQTEQALADRASAAGFSLARVTDRS
jgi:hypothetical protein